MKVGAYGAATSRSVGSEYEPSATEPVQVFLVVQFPLETMKFKIEVGSTALPELKVVTPKATGSKLSYTFIVPAGVKWKVKAVSGTISAMESSYLGL